MTNREAGIYKINNIKNEKFYIGSSVNTNKRIYRHISELRGNKHPNEKLQRAYNKYGEKAFEFEIMEYVDIQQLIEKEQFYIDTLNPEYNICRIAYSTLGRIPSVKTKLKMSKSHKGYKHSNESKIKMSNSKKGLKLTQKRKEQISESKKKPIHQFDKQGNFIKEWNTVSEALVTFKNVSSVLTGKRKTCGGYIWKYKNN